MIQFEQGNRSAGQRAIHDAGRIVSTIDDALRDGPRLRWWNMGYLFCIGFSQDHGYGYGISEEERKHYFGHRFFVPLLFADLLDDTEADLVVNGVERWLEGTENNAHAFYWHTSQLVADIGVDLIAGAFELAYREANGTLKKGTESWFVNQLLPVLRSTVDAVKEIREGAELITAKEASEVIGVTTRQVNRAATDGKLTRRPDGRFSRGEVERYKAQHANPQNKVNAARSPNAVAKRVQSDAKRKANENINAFLGSLDSGD